MATALLFLWAFQVMEYTARGAARPAEWNRSFSDPWRKLLRPALLMAAVLAQGAVIAVAVAKIAIVAGRSDAAVETMLARSPLFGVISSIVGILYLPAAMVSIGAFTGSIAHTLDPRRLVRTIVRMEHEYVYSVALIAVLGLVLGLLGFALQAIPVVGGMAFSAALAYATPMVGLILGRLLGRMAHVIA
jgi:hypothetical protein